jgi:thiol-disulfide isomerase/thioredoxin
MKLTTFGVLGVTCCLAIGCLGSSSTETTEIEAPATSPSPTGSADGKSPEPESTKAETTESAAPAARNVSLGIRSWSDFQEWVAQQKGKVVVVDVWSTSCGECVKEFPHFVELHDRLGDRIVCASFSVDFYGVGSPDELKPDVLEFLTEKHATSSNFLSSTADEKVMETLDVASIPAALVYDQSGELRKTFKNDNDDYGPDGFNYKDHINPFVEELLKPAGCRRTTISWTARPATNGSLRATTPERFQQLPFAAPIPSTDAQI